MKYFIFILSILIFCGCKTKDNKIIDYPKNFISDKTNVFDFSKEPLWSQLPIRSDFSEVKYKKQVVDTTFSKNIRKKINLYGLYYYSPLEKNKKLELYTLIGGWDNYQMIFLVSEINKQIVDFKILAEQSGDGGNFYGKNAIYKNGEFFSDFEESYSTFTCPIDTVTYHKKGKSRIWIDEKGKIHEDTLDIKYNYQILEKNPDCD